MDRYNENINELIDIIIRYKYRDMQPYCVYPNKQQKSLELYKECDDCDKCKSKFFEEMKKDMMKAYSIN